MKCEEGKKCPECGTLLNAAEKIRYGGKYDSRCEITVFCPGCGWKQHCRDPDESLFDYHL